MAIDIKTPSVSLATSTSSANVALPAGSGGYIRATNGSATILVWINAGGSSVTATNANIALGPGESRTFARDPNTDTYVAAIASSGTPTVVFSVVGESGLFS